MSYSAYDAKMNNYELPYKKVLPSDSYVVLRLDMQQLGGKLGIDGEETKLLLCGRIDITISDLEVL